VPVVTGRPLVAHGDDEPILEAIHVEAVIGFSDHEVDVLQPLEADLVISRRPSSSYADDPADVLDHKGLENARRGAFRGARFRLIEAFAEAVARHVLHHERVRPVPVTVHKPGALTGARGVAVRMTRSRR